MGQCPRDPLLSCPTQKTGEISRLNSLGVAGAGKRGRKRGRSSQQWGYKTLNRVLVSTKCLTNSKRASHEPSRTYHLQTSLLVVHIAPPHCNQDLSGRLLQTFTDHTQAHAESCLTLLDLGKENITLNTSGQWSREIKCEVLSTYTGFMELREGI